MTEATKICPVLTLPTSFGGSISIPVTQILEVCTLNGRTTLTMVENNQVVTLATDASHVKIMWLDILHNLSKMDVGFSQRDYDILPLMSEAEGKTLLTTAREVDLAAHEYAHHDDALRQWANEARLRLLAELKEVRTLDV